MKLERRTFVELGFREQQDLQEWITKQTAALAKELLVIRKEFVGFSDTNERLDLLALDKIRHSHHSRPVPEAKPRALPA